MTAPPILLTPGQSWLSKVVHVNADTGVESEVGLSAASVTIDRGADARRAVDATIETDLDPALLRAPHRLKVSAGVAQGGVEYWNPLAHVTIGSRTKTPLGLWQLRTCLSFEALVAKARFRSPRTIFGDTSMVTAMRTLILEAVPWATVDVLTSRDAQVPGGGKVYERERLQAVLGREDSLATALGVDVGCSGDGTFVVRDQPDAVTWALDEGPGGLLIDWSETSSYEDVVNVWVVYSDNPNTNPARAEVADTDPFSPTRVSRIGERVQFLQSPLMGTDDMCNTAGRTRLASSRGETVALDMTAVANPWADVTEMVSSRRDGVTSTHVLDRIQFGLKHDEPMRVTASARTVSLT